MAVVVAVKEAFLLIAVNRIVGGVEIERELLGRRLERGDELIDQDRCEPNERGTVDVVLETAQGGRRRQLGRAVDFGMIGTRLPERIESKAAVLVEIFVAGGKPEDALGPKRALGMHDPLRATRIGEGRIDGVEQADPPIGLAEQKQSGIGADVPGVELGKQFPLADAGKKNASRVTVRHRGGGPEWDGIGVVTLSNTKPSATAPSSIAQFR